MLFAWNHRRDPGSEADAQAAIASPWSDRLALGTSLPLTRARLGARALHNFNEATKALDPFIRSWHPSGMAHNDFYDDQMLLLRDGRIALVDFEESGPGDSMLDVGNFLAHLQGGSRFGRKWENDARATLCHVFRDAALERFRWSERELAFREAACLFRMCTNFIRHPQPGWLDKLEAGLALVNETLG